MCSKSLFYIPITSGKRRRDERLTHLFVRKRRLASASTVSVRFPLEHHFCTFLITLQLSCAWLDYRKLDKKILALVKVLEYIKKRPQQMNIDTTVGVTFAEVNLKAALQHSNVMFVKSHQKNFLEMALLLSKNTRNMIDKSVTLSSEAEARLSAGLNIPHIWLKPITWRKMVLENHFKPNPNLTTTDVVTSFFSGHPTADESDKCLLDLINNCELSHKCRKLVVNDNSSSTTGYSLTHRLLIKQTISALQCNTSISRFSPYLGYNLCYQILHDLMSLEAVGFPDIGRDLALEQIFLCGMEGYLDFLSEHYEQLILDWQHDSGCYRGFSSLLKKSLYMLISTNSTIPAMSSSLAQVVWVLAIETTQLSRGCITSMKPK
ncbi:UPF0764 protein C16orf89 homolog [Copidosoma floridanum]|uniref:UPF0764 protein C16orf89 homolog n=1 Tax=Copidosoma floridanum TaxID=29053 RepID=UPI000C6F5C57|nr:UPF0764 protein C16orf89 homolog [Copidosoma floridanum]